MPPAPPRNSGETTRLRSLVDHLPLPVILFTPNGRIETLNPAAARLLKLPVPPAANSVPSSVEKTSSWLFESVKETAESSEENHLLKRDLPEGCSERSYEVRLQQMRDPDGQLTGILVTFNNISEGGPAPCTPEECETHNQTLFEYGHSVMLLIDPATGDIVDANTAACLYYGYSHPVLVSRNINDINILPKEKIREEMNRARTQKRACFHFKHRLANGNIRDVEVYSGPVEIKGRLLLFSIVHDISKRVAAEERLRKIRAAVEYSPASVVITDREGTIEYVNRKFTQITGYPPELVLGQNPRVLKSGQTPDATYTELWQTILSKNEWRGRFYNLNSNGEVFLEEALISPVLDAEGEITHFVAVKEDVTERHTMEAKIWRQAHYDILTGIPNRGLFYDRLEQTLNLARRNQISAALLFIDLDHFKDVNDTYGHSKGDSLLRQVAERLRDAVRTSDTVARMGGDEFTVILQNLENREGVVQVAGNLLTRITEPFDLDGCCVTITGSVGFTMISAERTPEELLTEADRAMYRAKAMGRNRVVGVVA